MTITSINSTARLAASSPEASNVAAAAARQSSTPAPSEQQLDEVTQQPMPLRFPWLSRLSLQLETASRQRAAFAPAPPLGDLVDKSA